MYSAEISRRSPTAFVILVDQSGSMAEPFGMDASFTKAGFVADVVNKWLQNLVLRCAKGESVRDYFDIAVIGYGEAAAPLLGRGGLQPLSQIAGAPLRVEDRKRKVDDGAGGLVEMNVKFPVWVDAQASGRTAMRAALMEAHRLLATWVGTHDGSFPPTVVNITDGQGTDGDPRDAATTLRSLATDDGEVLLFNCHISGAGGRPVLYPTSVEDLPNAFAEALFEMSSPLPEAILKSAREFGHALLDGARGFAYQGDAAAFVSFLEIGTRGNNLPVVIE